MTEELLPGLVKMIEERFGRFGRLFTTLVVGMAGLGVIAWGVSQIWQLLAPAYSLVAQATPDLYLWSVGLVLFLLVALYVAEVAVIHPIQERERATRDKVDSDG